jgi:mycobactin lysine-N-oxygenase
MPRKIAVVGGGPKAAAIAAKAAALREDRYDAPEVLVYEALTHGAAWIGDHGYTDGEQCLCTPSERDLGYPFDHKTFGPAVANTMAAKFSWHAFKASRGKGIGEWVARGRRPAQHKEFAEYVADALRKSEARLVMGEVTGLRYDAEHDLWFVASRDHDRPLPEESVDGVVITGSGPPFPAFDGAEEQLVFDARGFWQRTDEVRSLIQAANRPHTEKAIEQPTVAIIGAGGTAAAVANWFLRAGYNHLRIRLVAPEATLFARRPGYFEDRFFGDDEEWSHLGWHHKRALVGRLTRGVVWDEVLARLENAQNVLFTSASADRFVRRGVAPADEFLLRIKHPSGRPNEPAFIGYVEATLFVDARGFNSWWFVDLLPVDQRPDLSTSEAKEAAIESFDDYLALAGLVPRLHVPMHGWMIGPAAPNLMALGWMADRILLRYVEPRTAI